MVEKWKLASRCAAVALLVIVLAAGTARQTAASKVSGIIRSSHQLQSAAGVYVLKWDRYSFRSSLLALDGTALSTLSSVEVPRSISPPDILSTPTGKQLYVLTGGAGTSTLSLIDAASWRTIARSPMPNRLRYNVAGPPTMVLSPDGSRLFVSNYRPLGGPNTAYWLAAVDRHSLQAVSARVPLSGCGVASLATAARQVVALCPDSNDVRFIDPATLRIASRVALPRIPEYHVEGRAFELAVSSDGMQVYVVTNDLRILVIDAVSHRLVRQVTAYRGAAQTVPVLYSVARTSDGAHLIVGVMARPRQPASPFSLRVFALPSLVLEKTVPLPSFVHFVTGPNGGLYAFRMRDSPDAKGPIQHLSPNGFRARAAGQLPGPITSIAVPDFSP